MSLALKGSVSHPPSWARSLEADKVLQALLGGHCHGGCGGGDCWYPESPHPPQPAPDPDRACGLPCHFHLQGVWPWHRAQPAEAWADLAATSPAPARRPVARPRQSLSRGGLGPGQGWSCMAKSGRELGWRLLSSWQGPCPRSAVVSNLGGDGGSPEQQGGPEGLSAQSPRAGSSDPGTICTSPSHGKGFMNLVSIQVFVIPGGGPTTGLTKEWAPSVLAPRPQVLGLGFG